MPSSTPGSQSPTPNSGIQTSATGDRHIPQSVRADGSVRKEIKIRPGYRPPEDVEVYKNRTAEAWKTRGQGGIPGAAGLSDDAASGADGKIAAGKNAKRREARKRAKAGIAAAEPDADAEVDDTVEDAAVTTTNGYTTNGTPSKPLPSSSPSATTPPTPHPETTDKQKQARNLRKKLRQARELKAKKESGGDLLPEQFAKVIKIQELIRQLDALGFDEDENENENENG